MDAKNTLKSDRDRPPYYAIMYAIDEARKHNKIINIEIEGIKLTVRPDSDLDSLWTLWVLSIIHVWNERDKKIFEKMGLYNARN